jgi:hypothetical protein
MNCARSTSILLCACAGAGELEKRLAGLGNQVEELPGWSYILTCACAGAGELEKRLAGLVSQVEELRRLYLYSILTCACAGAGELEKQPAGCRAR